MKFDIYSGIDLYCQQCQKRVKTLVVSGEKIFPHRPDLADHVFLQCPHCENYVSADALRKTDSMRTWQRRHEKKVIPTKDFRRHRQDIHALIDPIWKQGILDRGYIYKRLSEATGQKNFHNGSLSDQETYEKALTEAKKFVREAKILGYKPKRSSYL